MNEDNKQLTPPKKISLFSLKKITSQMLLVILLALIGLALFIGSNPFGVKDRLNDKQEEQMVEQVYELESRLEAILAGIEGVGKVEVMVTWDSGKEIVPLMEKQASGYGETTTGELDVFIKPVVVNGINGSEPVVVKELEPAIRGIIVVAEGADDIAVRYNLEVAVMTVLGVNEQYVEVFSMK